MKHASYLERGGIGVEKQSPGASAAAGMTQQQLADLVHVSSRTIISIEKEQYNPSLLLAYRIALVFGVSLEELCCLEENNGAGGQGI